ncbi:hypothetical protein [Shinella sp. HZN7]|nr:hypothetical protein [Shinella sp. HZN7]
MGEEAAVREPDKKFLHHGARRAVTQKERHELDEVPVGQHARRIAG